METKTPERCEYYEGVACIDGSCPVAHGDTETTCANCHRYRGCDDCIFDGTIVDGICPKYPKYTRYRGYRIPKPDAPELPFG